MRMCVLPAFFSLQISRISFMNIGSCKRNTIFEVDNKGLVSTFNIYGIDCVVVSSAEEEESSHNAVLCVEV